MKCYRSYTNMYITVFISIILLLHVTTIVDIILKRSGLIKKVSTYYRGLVSLIKDSNWNPGTIHGQLNQCVARTGRLSSSKPNLQNFDGDIKGLFKSRYEEIDNE